MMINPAVVNALSACCISSGNMEPIKAHTPMMTAYPIDSPIRLTPMPKVRGPQPHKNPKTSGAITLKAPA